jgi:multicomponent K+:H+ antiporter subunit G
MSELATPLELVAAVLAFTGAFLFLAGAVGFLRLPDFYTRIHAPTKAASLGIPLMAFASMLLHLGAGFDLWIEDALIMLFVFLANPVSTQMLVWAAVARNIRPSVETQGQPASEMGAVSVKTRKQALDAAIDLDAANSDSL